MARFGIHTGLISFHASWNPWAEFSRQYFVNCYIEGTTDYIFGPATAVFQNCTIRSKTNSFITAASTTQGKKFGYVFLDCKILVDSNVTKLYLGRPWRAYSKTVFIHCEMPKQIAPEGWNNWSNPENEKTAFYAEYKNTGEGADTKNRAAWSKQLTDKEAKEYTLENIFLTENTNAPSEPGWFQQIRTKSFEWPVDKK